MTYNNNKERYCSWKDWVINDEFNSTLQVPYSICNKNNNLTYMFIFKSNNKKGFLLPKFSLGDDDSNRIYAKSVVNLGYLLEKNINKTGFSIEGRHLSQTKQNSPRKNWVISTIWSCLLNLVFQSFWTSSSAIEAHTSVPCYNTWNFVF